MSDPLTIHFEVTVVAAVSAATVLHVTTETTAMSSTTPEEFVSGASTSVTGNCLRGTLTDPLAPTNPGDTLFGQIDVDNTVSIPITGTVQTTLDPGLTLVPGSCTSTGGLGLCAELGPRDLTWTGVITPDGAAGKRASYPAIEAVVGPAARGGRVYLPLGGRSH